MIKVSDLHFGHRRSTRFREQGRIITTDYLMDEETFFGWREILSDQQIEQFKENLEYDGATQYEGGPRAD